MKAYRSTLFIFCLITSCSQPTACPEFDYNSLNKITTFNDIPYTGRCSVIVNNSISSIQQYLDGIDFGVWIFYYENGRIQTKGKFNKDGNRVGKWKYYFEDGNIKQISKYSKNGERRGKWKLYNEDGELISSTNYN